MNYRRFKKWLVNFSLFGGQVSVSCDEKQKQSLIQLYRGGKKSEYPVILFLDEHSGIEFKIETKDIVTQLSKQCSGDNYTGIVTINVES